MVDIGRKGRFYLGKEHDLEKGETVGPQIMCKSADLTTHGFCVGTTGSGKAGLCICVAEEAEIIERAADIDMKYLDYADDIEEYRIAPAAVKVKRFGVLWLAIDES